MQKSCQSNFINQKTQSKKTPLKQLNKCDPVDNLGRSTENKQNFPASTRACFQNTNGQEHSPIITDQHVHISSFPQCFKSDTMSINGSAHLHIQHTCVTYHQFHLGKGAAMLSTRSCLFRHGMLYKFNKLKAKCLHSKFYFALPFRLYHLAELAINLTHQL